jgi:hypothetical protein
MEAPRAREARVTDDETPGRAEESASQMTRN